MTKEEFEREAGAIRASLVTTATALTGDADEAEDVVQETMLKLWAMVDELRHPIKPLASVLMRHLCIDRQRRRKPVVSIQDGLVAEPAVIQEDSERIDRMMKMIETLPTSQQIILRLRHVEGLEFSDIAKLTGSNEAAVRKALSRARLAVKKRYNID